MNANCVCCRLPIPGSPIQRIHLDCWIEHHSDPIGPDHVCDATITVAVETDAERRLEDRT